MSPHRVWFWQDGRFEFNPSLMGSPVRTGAQPSDAAASGGSWRVDQEEPLNISFSPSWCRLVRMRDCRRSTFPDGTEEVQSNNVEVQW